MSVPSIALSVKAQLTPTAVGQSRRLSESIHLRRKLNLMANMLANPMTAPMATDMKMMYSHPSTIHSSMALGTPPPRRPTPCPSSASRLRRCAAPSTAADAPSLNLTPSRSACRMRYVAKLIVGQSVFIMPVRSPSLQKEREPKAIVRAGFRGDDLA